MCRRILLVALLYVVGVNAIGGLVATFSMLAVVTSLIGFTFGLLDAWTDVFNLPTKGKEFEKVKVPLYALVFAPPLALSVLDPNIFYSALDYAGAFGVSTLFLVLPPFMVWKERYGDDNTPLATKPMGEFSIECAVGALQNTVLLTDRARIVAAIL